MLCAFLRQELQALITARDDSSSLCHPICLCKASHRSAKGPRRLNSSCRISELVWSSACQYQSPNRVTQTIPYFGLGQDRQFTSEADTACVFSCTEGARVQHSELTPCHHRTCLTVSKETKHKTIASIIM